MALHPEDLRRGRIYPRTALLAAGMHPRHIASDGMTRVLPGYFARSDALPSLAETARLLQGTLRPRSIISHQTAAELLGFPLPVEMTSEGGAALHCRGPVGAPRTTGKLVVVHGADGSRPAVSLRGVEVSDPVLVLRDLGCQLSHADLVACVDALVSVGKGALLDRSLDQVRSEVEALRGPGSVRLREAVADARERVWSPMESRFRLLLTSRGFPCPAMNLTVRDPATEQTFIIDMAYEDSKVAIEYDGDGHRSDVRRWRRDLHKNEVLHQLGWVVLRASIGDYHHPERFLLRLGHALSPGRGGNVAMLGEVPLQRK